MLIATKDEHERRTLIEDIVGKILLACWRGVASEIMQVLTAVVDRYINDGAVEWRLWATRATRLSNFAWFINGVIDYIPGDYSNPLQRIMNDASHGVSKHQLLLIKRAELASQSNEARLTLKRKRGTSVCGTPDSGKSPLN
ncbi:hypothetical protein EDC04DRAFT_2687990 [Pisolithus marmoratus]|nr:hypothetical protein EDC04DRAFT_2687990 [Pisolithus marmoratus]